MLDAVDTVGPAIDFEAIYEAHVDFVWRSLWKLGVPESHLEDAVQDVFVVVHRRLAEFEGRSAMTTWLFAIAIRVSQNHRRTLRRKGETAEFVDRFADSAASPAESSERAEALRTLSRVLDDLDDDKRTVFVMAELEQMPVREIAEVLDANANTVSARLRAARAEFDKAVSRFRARSK